VNRPFTAVATSAGAGSKPIAGGLRAARLAMGDLNFADAGNAAARRRRRSPSRRRDGTSIVANADGGASGRGRRKTPTRLETAQRKLERTASRIRGPQGGYGRHQQAFRTPSAGHGHGPDGPDATGRPARARRSDTASEARPHGHDGRRSAPTRSWGWLTAASGRIRKTSPWRAKSPVHT
jgi:hypothetical protein